MRTTSLFGPAGALGCGLCDVDFDFKWSGHFPRIPKLWRKVVGKRRTTNTGETGPGRMAGRCVAMALYVCLAVRRNWRDVRHGACKRRVDRQGKLAGIVPMIRYNL